MSRNAGYCPRLEVNTMYRQRFRVTGAGRFPIDMLRYDSCHPASERDTALITAEEPDTGTRTVELIVMGSTRTGFANMLTPRRWQSFGWTLELPLERPQKY